MIEVTGFSVHESLLQNYDAYYDGNSEWRRLGALDKAKNIQALCADITHRKVLEIGAGEGSILQVLADERFAESLYALEISASAVGVIREEKFLYLRIASCLTDIRSPMATKNLTLSS